jgi:hypothetical protein
MILGYPGGTAINGYPPQTFGLNGDFEEGSETTDNPLPKN